MSLQQVEPLRPVATGLRFRPRAPLVWHVAGLCVLLAVLWASGPRGHGFTDDGVALEAQVEALAGGSWGVAHPYPAVDPEGRFYPDRNAQPMQDGTFAPYIKHPLVPLLLVLPRLVAGVAGVELAVTAGLVGAALAMAGLVRRVDRRAAVVAFWLVGAGSVLLVHGFVLWVHAWALAVAAVVATAMLDICAGHGARRTWVPRALLLGGVVLLILLRTEGIVFAGAAAITLAATGLRRRDRTLATLGIATLAVAAATFVGETWIVRELVGDAAGAIPGAGVTRGDVVGERLWAVGFVFFIGGLSPAMATLRLVAALALVAGALRARRGVRGPELWAHFVVSAAAYVVLCQMTPLTIPGFLPAMPILAAGLLLPRLVRRPGLEVLATAGLVYLVLLAATLYPGGAGGDWGGRYAILAAPLLAPLVAAGMVDLGRSVARTDAAVVVGCLLLATVAPAPAVFSDLRQLAFSASDARVAVLADAARHRPAPTTGRPVVVVVDHHFSRFLSLDQGSLTPLRAVDVDGLALLLDRLGQQPIDEVLVICRSGELDVAPGPVGSRWWAEEQRPLTPWLFGITLRRAPAADPGGGPLPAPAGG